MNNTTEIAKITRHGSPDYGHWKLQCDNPACRDLNGRPWCQIYSRRLVEFHALAVRDRDAHNKSRHGE